MPASTARGEVEQEAGISGNKAFLVIGGAEGGAVGDLDDAIDADLAIVIDLWEELSPETRAEIRDRVSGASKRTPWAGWRPGGLS